MGQLLSALNLSLAVTLIAFVVLHIRRIVAPQMSAEWELLTLASIGDAIFVVTGDDRVNFANPGGHPPWRKDRTSSLAVRPTLRWPDRWPGVDSGGRRGHSAGRARPRRAAPVRWGLEFDLASKEATTLLADAKMMPLV